MSVDSDCHVIDLGLSVMKSRFLRVLHGAGLPFHEIAPARVVYPADGPMVWYFHCHLDPVVPVSARRSLRRWLRMGHTIVATKTEGSGNRCSKRARPDLNAIGCSIEELSSRGNQEGIGPLDNPRRLSNYSTPSLPPAGRGFLAAAEEALMTRSPSSVTPVIVIHCALDSADDLYAQRPAERRTS